MLTVAERKWYFVSGDEALVYEIQPVSILQPTRSLVRKARAGELTICFPLLAQIKGKYWFMSVYLDCLPINQPLYHLLMSYLRICHLIHHSYRYISSSICVRVLHLDVPPELPKTLFLILYSCICKMWAPVNLIILFLQFTLCK